MKNIAAGSSRLCGICVEKLQVGLPDSMAVFVHPSAPNGFPGIGVPKAVRVYIPLEFGPTVLYGSQSPLLAIVGSSLKSPLRMRAVGTEKTCEPAKCRIW